MRKAKKNKKILSLGGAAKWATKSSVAKKQRKMKVIHRNQAHFFRNEVDVVHITP